MNKESLSFFIKSTLENEKHLGDNLKKRCIDYVESLQQEKQQLKDNWNKLKEYLITNINYWQEQEKEWIKLGFINFGGKANSKIIFKKVLDKMQELEGSDSNE